MLNHKSGPFIIAKGAPPPYPRTPESFTPGGEKGRCGDAIWARLSALVNPGECAERWGGDTLDSGSLAAVRG